MSQASQLAFAARDRAKKAEAQARRDRELEFQRQQALQAQQASAAQQQAMLQANLSSMQAGAAQYQQDQNRQRAAYQYSLGEPNRRMDARAAAVFQDNLRRDTGREQARISSDVMNQQAGIQSERDAALHGYGQDDARLNNVFDRGMANLNQGHVLDRATQQQQFGQRNAAQAQQYGLQTGAVQQGYSQDNARLSSQLGMDQDKFRLGLDQQGADAQQVRGQQDARFTNDMQQGNAYDSMIQQKLDQGWTYSPEDEPEVRNIKLAMAALPKKVREHVIEPREAARQFELLKDSLRYFHPEVPPSQINPEQRFNEATFVDPATGVRYGLGDKGPSLLHDPNAAQSGQKSGGPFDPKTGRLTYQEEKKVRSEMKKGYDNYVNGLQPDDSGKLPKKMSYDDYIRQETPYLSGPDQQVFESYMDRESSAKPAGQSVVADWQQMGADFIKNGMNPQGPAAEAREWGLQRDSIETDPKISVAILRSPGVAGPLVTKLKSAMAKYMILLESNHDPDDHSPGLLDHIRNLKSELEQIGTVQPQSPTVGSGKPPDWYGGSTVQPSDVPGAWIPRSDGF